MRAAKALKATWSDSAALPTRQQLYDADQDAGDRSRRRRVGRRAGRAPRAAKTVRAQYRWPFQMHASIGPSCGVADVKRDSRRSGRRRRARTRSCAPIAELLGLPSENVHVIWTEGSGCYGHNGSDDAAADAALLSQAVGQAGARAVVARRRARLGAEGRRDG